MGQSQSPDAVGKIVAGKQFNYSSLIRSKTVRSIIGILQNFRDAP